MAGVTDWAFRTICARMGAGLTVTEMVSSRALVYRDRKSAGLLRKNEGSVVGAQIFGNDPEVMAQGAALAMEISGCDFIDINMGCPMAKVVSNGDGSALMNGSAPCSSDLPIMPFPAQPCPWLRFAFAAPVAARKSFVFAAR